MIVQIYEIQTEQEARTMIDLGVDHIGSVITSTQTWQNTEIKHAVDLVRKAARKSSLIVLSTDTSCIQRCLDYYKPDIVHFCEALPTTFNADGALTAIVNRQHKIRERYPEIQIMRSIPIADTGFAHLVPSLALAKVFEPISDWFLTDTLLVSGNSRSIAKKQPVEGYVGITGRTCDWRTARLLVEMTRVPVILAGGIGPENVHEGVLAANPAGVDSCTRTNAVDSDGRTMRFKKDPAKVRELIATARRAPTYPAPRARGDEMQNEFS